MPDDTERYQNLAAVAVLMGPEWATPRMQQYAAAHPRCERGLMWKRGIGHSCLFCCNLLLNARR